MRAMVYRGPYRIRVEDKDRPSIEHPNDAVIRVTRAAICGSDLHLYHGMMPDTRVGMTFGHEFIGVVDEVGSSVQNLAVGDRVMVPFNISAARVSSAPGDCTRTATTSTPTRRRSVGSTATRTRPAATTVARRSSFGCRSPTSARAASLTG